MFMRLIAGLLAGLVLLSPFAPAASPPAEDPLVPACAASDKAEKVAELLKQFTTLYKEGKFAEAEAMARRARELDPENLPAVVAVQIARRQQGVKKSDNWEKVLERRLAAMVSVECDGTPLNKVIDDLRDSQHINIVADMPAMQEAGVNLETPVTVKLDQVSLKTALKRILQQVKLTYVVKDEVVLITTQPHACKPRAITYAVADLTVPTKRLPGKHNTRTDIWMTEGALIKVITSTIEPNTWSKRGGLGTIDYFPLGKALVVHQTPDIHEKIGDFLAFLRRPEKEVVPQPPGGLEASEETAEPAVAKEPAVMHVNCRSFTLAYDVENEGPSKVVGVVVWYTRDGKTWSNYPEQLKPTKSIPINVVSDGRYGFTLVARSGAGLSVPPPKSGDDPQVWVEVDTMQPVAELYAPQPDTDKPGTLVVTWKANDRNLTPQPITLKWSSDAAGPWHLISADLPNTGRHAWQVPTDLPSQVYLRLTVHDSAGNKAVAQTHEAVVVDVKVPAIRGVRVKVKE
jgi:hypothetical protein